MSALRKSQRILSKLGYFGNFLNTRIELGDIYELDDRQFILLTNISNVNSKLRLTKPKLRTGTKGNLNYTKESNIDVKFNGDVSAPHLGSGEVELLFNSKNSAFVSLRNTVTKAINMDMIKPDLVEFWDQKGYSRSGKHIIIFQIVEATSGTVIFSQERNNRVILKSISDQSFRSVNALGSGEFEFVTNTKATLESISKVKHVPLFKALFIKPNGNYEILG